MVADRLVGDYADPFKPHPAPSADAEAEAQKWQAVIDKVLEKA